MFVCAERERAGGGEQSADRAAARGQTRSASYAHSVCHHKLLCYFRCSLVCDWLLVVAVRIYALKFYAMQLLVVFPMPRQWVTFFMMLCCFAFCCSAVSRIDLQRRSTWCSMCRWCPAARGSSDGFRCAARRARHGRTRSGLLDCAFSFVFRSIIESVCHVVRVPS